MSETERVMDFRMASWLRHKGDCEDDRCEALDALWTATMQKFREQRDRERAA